ncbi:hypothetical protein [Noviherbaspirillum saxi]|uniref:Carboxypeptidase regulatory-like domain-containing protein n=1 Tax=Noviherbaspirillum saxi TaxID=2320863 RepID=A0A3A3FSR1_9BURK|nr:hypothetical protein [Noviherbaspirillum saxi]RJF99086.1 hypothetical protein D3871_11590 [Noviherbaspirillum saxi]
MKNGSLLSMALGLSFPLLALAQTSIPQRDFPREDAGAAGITSQGIPAPGRELSSGGANATASEAGIDAATEMGTPPSPTDRLKPVTTNDITYLCGGIGEEESNYMKQQARDYDLMLTFAARDGAYLADIAVDIHDAAGNEVLQARCDSPILLVDLPKRGTYRVSADAAGHVLQRQVKVNAGPKTGRQLARAVLVWPQEVAEVQGSGTMSGGSGGAPATRDAGSR